MEKTFVLFCEQLYGVGHIKRTINIAESLLQKDPTADIHIIFGGKSNDKILIPNNITLHQLSVLESQYDMKLSQKTVESITRIRMKEIANILVNFNKIDCLLVDMFPFTRLNLIKHYTFLLDSTRKIFPEVKIACYIRDFEPRLNPISELAILKKISDYFDVIFICGEQEKTDALASYSILRWAEKIIFYTGFVTPVEKDSLTESTIQKHNNYDNLRCVVSIGGGRDGFQTLTSVIKSIKPYLLNNRSAIVDIFQSEYFTRDESSDISNIGDIPGVRLHKFSTEFSKYLQNAHIHLCMGGYNSVSESLKYRAFPIIIPRETNAEQRSRAEYLQREGLAYLLRLSDLNPESLAKAIKLAKEAAITGKTSVNTNGGSEIADFIIQDKFFDNSVMMENLKNIVWCMMKVCSNEDPNRLLPMWSSCVKLAERIDWNSEITHEYLYNTSDNEFFPRVVILPKQVFEELSEKYDRKAQVYSHNKPFEYQIFEQLYIVRKRGGSSLRTLLRDMGKEAVRTHFQTIMQIQNMM